MTRVVRIAVALVEVVGVDPCKEEEEEEEHDDDDDEVDERRRSFFCRWWRVELLFDLAVAGRDGRGCFGRDVEEDGEEQREDEDGGRECLKAEGFNEASISKGDTVKEDEDVDEDNGDVFEDDEGDEGVKDTSCLSPVMSVGT